MQGSISVTDDGYDVVVEDIRDSRTGFGEPAKVADAIITLPSGEQRYARIIKTESERPFPPFETTDELIAECRAYETDAEWELKKGHRGDLQSIFHFSMPAEKFTWEVACQDLIDNAYLLEDNSA